MIPYSDYLAGRKLTKVTSGVTSSKNRLDRHSYFNLLRLAVDNVGEHFDAFLEVHVSNHVRKRVTEAARRVLIGDRKCINRAPSARLYPLHVGRQATGADHPGMELHGAAILAALDVELVPLGCLPVGPVLLVETRQDLLVGFLFFRLGHIDAFW